MDTLLSPSDVTASPGLIIPMNMGYSVPVKTPTYNPYIYPYNKEENKIVGDMTFDELANRLDGKVGIGWRWVLIIVLFGILIIFLIPILVGSLLQALKVDKLIAGARNYKIFDIPEGSTTSVIPDSTSSYILNVDYGNNQPDNIIQSTVIINGSVGSIPFNLFNGSIHTFTVSSSFGETSGSFSTLLIVRSITSSDGVPVVFRLLGELENVSEFRVSNNVINPLSGTTYTASREFIWNTGNILIEINTTIGIAFND